MECKCGYKIRADFQFCPKCGADLGDLLHEEELISYGYELIHGIVRKLFVEFSNARADLEKRICEKINTEIEKINFTEILAPLNMTEDYLEYVAQSIGKILLLSSDWWCHTDLGYIRDAIQEKESRARRCIAAEASKLKHKRNVERRVAELMDAASLMSRIEAVHKLV